MQLQIFRQNELGTVEVLELNDEVFFNANDVGVVLGIQRIKDSLDVSDEDYALKITNNMLFSDGGTTPNRNLNNRGETFLTEAGLYKVLFSSRKPIAKVFQKWVTKEVLPTIRKMGSYSLPTSPQQTQQQITLGVQDCLTASETIAKMFNINGIEKVKMTATILEGYDYGNVAKALPTYQNTKFVGTMGEVSERVAHAYSYHRKQNPTDYELSAKAFNKIAEALEVLTTERTSKNKKFKVLSKKYLDWGKNIVASQSTTTTQPHYYDDTFDELYWAVTENKLNTLFVDDKEIPF
jgi:prophage antirepressor-like protein